VKKKIGLWMALVPLFAPISGQRWTLWREILGEDIALHAMRLLVDGFWHDLLTQALATSWQIETRDTEQYMIRQWNVATELFERLETEETDWLRVHYRSQPLMISSLFYNTRRKVLTAMAHKAVKEAGIAARSEFAFSIYMAFSVICLSSFATVIPCDTQSTTLLIIRLLLQMPLNMTTLLVKLTTLGIIPINYTYCA
jgi:hypothetical protein